MDNKINLKRSFGLCFGWLIFTFFLTTTAHSQDVNTDYGVWQEDFESGCYFMKNFSKYVSHNGGGLDYWVDRTVPAVWEKFQINNLGNGIVTIQDQQGNYMSAQPSGVVHKVSTPYNWEKWKIYKKGGKYFILPIKAEYDDDGASSLSVIQIYAFIVLKMSTRPNNLNNRYDTEYLQEKLADLQRQYDLDNSFSLIKVPDGGCFSATTPIHNPLIARQHGVPDGTYRIQNVATENYLSNNGAGSVEYYANRHEPGEWEDFIITRNSDGTYYIRDIEGAYLSAQNLGLVHKKPAGDWEKWNIIFNGSAYIIKSYSDTHLYSADSYRVKHGSYSVFKKYDRQQKDLDPTGQRAQRLRIREERAGSWHMIPADDATRAAVIDLNAMSLTAGNGVTIPGALTNNHAEMTIEAWVKNEGGTESIQGVVSSAGLDFVHLQVSDDTNVKCVAYVDNGEVYLPAIPKSTGQWQHVAMVVKSGQSQLYINGEPHGPADTQTFTSIRSADNMLIGNGYNQARPFTGKIANVRIWDKAKSRPEINLNILNFKMGGAPGLLYYSPTSNPLNVIAATDCPDVPSEATGAMQSVTIEAWVNTHASPAPNEIQAVVSAIGPEFVHLQMSGDANVNNAVYLADGGTLMLPAIPALAPGWHHVAMVVESGNSKVYLDGQQVGATNNTTFTGIRPSASVSMGKGWQGGRIFHGRIADVRIWKNRALTQSQIQAYRYTPPRVDAPGLVFHLF